MSAPVSQQGTDEVAENVNSFLKNFDSYPEFKPNTKLSSELENQINEFKWKWLKDGEMKDYSLREHQKQGLRWLVRLWSTRPTREEGKDRLQKRLGGIIADNMGMGKTAQTMAYLCHLRNNLDRYDVQGNFLLIVPIGTIGEWLRQAFCMEFPMNDIKVVTAKDTEIKSQLNETQELFVASGYNIDVTIQPKDTDSSKRTSKAEKRRIKTKNSAWSKNFMNSTGTLVITSDTFIKSERNDKNQFDTKWFTAQRWSVVVMDEAHDKLSLNTEELSKIKAARTQKPTEKKGSTHFRWSFTKLANPMGNTQTKHKGTASPKTSTQTKHKGTASPKTSTQTKHNGTQFILLTGTPLKTTWLNLANLFSLVLPQELDAYFLTGRFNKDIMEPFLQNKNNQYETLLERYKEVTGRAMVRRDRSMLPKQEGDPETPKIQTSVLLEPTKKQKEILIKYLDLYREKQNGTELELDEEENEFSLMNIRNKDNRIPPWGYKNFELLLDLSSSLRNDGKALGKDDSSKLLFLTTLIENVNAKAEQTGDLTEKKILIFTPRVRTIDMLFQFLNFEFKPTLGTVGTIKGQPIRWPQADIKNKDWVSPFYASKKRLESKDDTRDLINQFSQEYGNLKKEDQRIKYMAQFNNNKEGKIHILLMTQQAAGVGLNLPEARHVVMFSSEDTPNLDDQAMMRGLRSDSQTGIHVYRLITKETSEEWAVNEYVQRMKRSFMILEWQNEEGKKNFYESFEDPDQNTMQETKDLISLVNQEYKNILRNKKETVNNVEDVATFLQSKEYFEAMDRPGIPKKHWWVFQGRNYRSDEPIEISNKIQRIARISGQKTLSLPHWWQHPGPLMQDYVNEYWLERCMRETDNNPYRSSLKADFGIKTKTERFLSFVGKLPLTTKEEKNQFRLTLRKELFEADDFVLLYPLNYIGKEDFLHENHTLIIELLQKAEEEKRKREKAEQEAKKKEEAEEEARRKNETEEQKKQRRKAAKKERRLLQALERELQEEKAEESDDGDIQNFVKEGSEGKQPEWSFKSDQKEIAGVQKGNQTSFNLVLQLETDRAWEVLYKKGEWCVIVPNKQPFLSLTEIVIFTLDKKKEVAKLHLAFIFTNTFLKEIIKYTFASNGKDDAEIFLQPMIYEEEAVNLKELTKLQKGVRETLIRCWEAEVTAKQKEDTVEEAKSDAHQTSRKRKKNKIFPELNLGRLQELVKERFELTLDESGKKITNLKQR